MKLKHEQFGEHKAIFGRGMHFQHRGVQYLLIAPTDTALEDAWFDIHPSAKNLNPDQVKDVGVMAEDVIRGQFNGRGDANG